MAVYLLTFPRWARVLAWSCRVLIRYLRWAEQVILRSATKRKIDIDDQRIIEALDETGPPTAGPAIKEWKY